MEDIILLGDFNAGSKDEETTMFRYQRGCLWRTYGGSGWSKATSSMCGVTEYGKHFLALGSAHGFVIYNGLSQ